MASPLSLYDRLYLWFFYFVRSFQYDLPENRVGWRSRKNQELRFRSILGIADLEGQKILDLGCGLGCLYGYLKGKGWSGEYTGIDVLDMMVEGARRRFPEARFEKRDILRRPPDERWDYVLINGVFNHRVKDNWAWIDRTVKAAFDMAEKGLAFNILSQETGWRDPELFYVDPRALEKKAREWSNGKCRIEKGYLDEDIAVHLYH